MPGIGLGATKKCVGKARDISRERGYYRPVVLSDSQGCMALLSGAATYEACLEDKTAKVPAVIVETAGEADGLMFALQSAELDEPPNAVAVSAAIVQLIDSHCVPRKQIAETLGKSPAWIAKMESLSRRLNATVRAMVVEGQVPARSAQEIARLPDNVQVQVAVSAANEFLSKESVTYLVNRYLNEDTSAQERERIVQTPKLALPDGHKGRARVGRDNSDGARLSRAIARCMDGLSSLSGLLDRLDAGSAAVRMADIMPLADSLDAMLRQIQTVFYPGKNGGDADD
jgi:ParB-like chromosome segregation protein Spo0J